VAGGGATQTRRTIQIITPGETDADGFIIVKDYLGEDQFARFREGLKPYLNTYRGRNSFEGLATERVYTLVSAAESTRRSRATTGCSLSSTDCSHPTTC